MKLFCDMCGTEIHTDGHPMVHQLVRRENDGIKIYTLCPECFDESKYEAIRKIIQQRKEQEATK